MRIHLVPCSGCTRHVRVSEVACPFCGRVLEEALRKTPPPVGPMRGLGRAAIFAFGVAVAAPAMAGCGGSSKVEGGTTTTPAAQPAPGPVAQPTPAPSPAPAPQPPPDDDYGGMMAEYGVAPED